MNYFANIQNNQVLKRFVADDHVKLYQNTMQNIAIFHIVQQLIHYHLNQQDQRDGINYHLDQIHLLCKQINLYTHSEYTNLLDG